MEFFKQITDLMNDDMTTTIVIRKCGAGKVSVSTNFTTTDGRVSEALPPFMLKGTVEEMDKGYFEAIVKPVETVSGLISNLKEFDKAAEEAKKKAASTAKPSASSDIAKKAAEMAAEKKKKEEEEKKRKKDIENFKKNAEEALKKNRFNTADAYYSLLQMLIDSTDEKNEIAEKRKVLEPYKTGFLCADSQTDFDTVISQNNNTEQSQQNSAPTTTQSPQPKPAVAKCDMPENNEDEGGDFPGDNEAA